MQRRTNSQGRFLSSVTSEAFTLSERGGAGVVPSITEAADGTASYSSEARTGIKIMITSKNYHSNGDMSFDYRIYNQTSSSEDKNSGSFKKDSAIAEGLRTWNDNREKYNVAAVLTKKALFDSDKIVSELKLLPK